MTTSQLPWHNPERTQNLLDALNKRILIMDGAMGTMVQNQKLDETAFRGERFAKGCDSQHEHEHTGDGGCEQDLQGDNDLLSITQPDIIRQIHKDNLDAGSDMVESNTFNATRLSQSDYKLEHVAYELNEQGTRLAREACDEAEKADPSRPRFAIGVLGPTSRTASLSPDVNDPGYRNVDYQDLVDNYAEATEGLIAGGADILLIETIFDTLNAKAAIYAVNQVFDKLGSQVPLMISGTITDRSGRTLSGQTPEAFYYSIKHARPLSVGFNCALGGDELQPHVQALANVADCRISSHPNAGLPNELAEYDEEPETTAGILEGYAKEGLLNMVGGCCGTTPEHIKAIAETVSKYEPRPLPSAEAAA